MQAGTQARFVFHGRVVEQRAQQAARDRGQRAHAVARSCPRPQERAAQRSPQPQEKPAWVTRSAGAATRFLSGPAEHLIASFEMLGRGLVYAPRRNCNRFAFESLWSVL